MTFWSVSEVLRNGEMDLIEEPSKLGVCKDLFSVKKLIKDRCNQTNKMVELDAGNKIIF